MNVSIEIPDAAAELLPNPKDLSRELLEAFASDSYRNNKMTRRQVGLLLGLDRWETEDLLVRHDALRPFSLDDYSLEHR